MKKEKHPSGATIIFNEDPHIYYLEDKPDEIFTSVTQLCKKYRADKDFVKIAKTYAKKNNLNKKHVKAEWDKKAELGSHRGNSVHAYAESLVTGVPSKLHKQYENYYKQIKIRFKRQFKHSDELISEYIVGLLDAKKAGMIDLLQREKNIINIIDWKTNETIKVYNKFQKMKSPFEKLDDCDLNIYKLQLNIYRYILIKENYFPGCEFKMWLYHVREHGIINIPVLNMDDSILKQIIYK